MSSGRRYLPFDFLGAHPTPCQVRNGKRQLYKVHVRGTLLVDAANGTNFVCESAYHSLLKTGRCSRFGFRALRFRGLGFRVNRALAKGVSCALEGLGLSWNYMFSLVFWKIRVLEFGVVQGLIRHPKPYKS